MRARPLHAIAGFAAHLREHGLAVGVAEQQAMVRAAQAIDVGDAARLRAGWRAIACHRAVDWRKFPGLFDDYWQPQRRGGNVRISGQTRRRRDTRDLRDLVREMQSAMSSSSSSGSERADDDADNTLRDTALAANDSSVDSNDPGRKSAVGGASRTEPLAQRDFALWLPQDLSRLQRIVTAIAQRMRERLLRRQRVALHGRRLDVRRTLRASLRYGGVPAKPVWRAPRRERPRIFVLVDVSRSMETFAQLFLRIARAFVTALDAGQVRVFVFHTRLAEITPLLARDSARVQDKINAVTAGFGGGTRIATSLRDFAAVHARRSLSRSSRLLVLSDGFDSDPPEQLALALAAVRARGARIYWLHPTKSAPQSAAIAGCRDLIAGFAPVHNLDSLARVRRLVE